MSTYNQEQGDIVRITVEEAPVEVVVPTEEVVDAPVEKVPAEPVIKKK